MNVLLTLFFKLGSFSCTRETLQSGEWQRSKAFPTRPDLGNSGRKTGGSKLIINEAIFWVKSGSPGQTKAYEHGKVKAMPFMPSALTCGKKLHSIVVSSNMEYE